MKQFLNNWGMEIVAMIAAFLAPISSYIIYCSILVIADLITGLMKASKLNPDKGWVVRYEPYRPSFVKSRKLGKTISKWIIYTLGLLVAHGATINFYPDYELAKALAMAVTFVEVKSIDENMEVILGYSIFGKLFSTFSRAEEDVDKEESESNNSSNP